MHLIIPSFLPENVAIIGTLPRYFWNFRKTIRISKIFKVEFLLYLNSLRHQSERGSQWIIWFFIKIPNKIQNLLILTIVMTPLIARFICSSKWIIIGPAQIIGLKWILRHLLISTYFVFRLKLNRVFKNVLQIPWFFWIFSERSLKSASKIHVLLGFRWIISFEWILIDLFTISVSRFVVIVWVITICLKWVLISVSKWIFPFFTKRVTTLRLLLERLIEFEISINLFSIFICSKGVVLRFFGCFSSKTHGSWLLKWICLATEAEFLRLFFYYWRDVDGNRWRILTA